MIELEDHACSAGFTADPAQICASQIQELQKEYGGTGEGSEPIKPLAHILLEAKQAKDEAFQNQWKQMKQGVVTVYNLL